MNCKYNKQNEIAKYRFFQYMEHSKGRSLNTMDKFITSIHEFEVATNFKNFNSFNHETAIRFKEHLQDKKNVRSGENISKSTFVNYCLHVKDFFLWLKQESKDFSKIKAKDIEYFNVKQNDLNTVKAQKIPQSHNIKDLLATIRKMPSCSIIEKRNKAFFSLALMTSPRIESLKTATIKSIKYFEEYNSWAFIQLPSQQKTKYSKAINSFFVGGSDDIMQNLISWRSFLIEQGFGDNDYLFPKIPNSFNKEQELEYELTNHLIKSTSPFTSVFKEAFSNNNLEYIKPHNIRHSITRFVQSEYDSVQLNIAIAVNFGHNNKMPTLINSYGGNYLSDQVKLINSIRFE